MRGLLSAALACLGLAAATPAPAHMAVLIPIVPVHGASTTTVFGINDSDEIAGSFIGKNDGVEHAFFGTLAGKYKTFDAGSGGTEARAMNNKGIITGFSNSQTCCTSGWPMFERMPSGHILNVRVGGTQLYGIAQGINNSIGTFAAGYWNFTAFSMEGFIGRRGQWKHAVNIPRVNQASGAFGINSANDIVGFYFSPPDHGFILSHGVLTVVDYPGSGGTVLQGINDNGQAVGQWTGVNNNNTHSFLLDIATSTITDIKVKGAKQVFAWNINAVGAVAVSSDVGSFIWCATRTGCPRGGFETDAPAHLIAKGFPHTLCGRVCIPPAVEAARARTDQSGSE